MGFKNCVNTLFELKVLLFQRIGRSPNKKNSEFVLNFDHLLYSIPGRLINNQVTNLMRCLGDFLKRCNPGFIEHNFCI